MLFQTVTLTAILAPYRFRSMGTSGTPLLYPMVWLGLQDQVQNQLASGKPVNDSKRQSETVTLTDNPTVRPTVKVTGSDRYGSAL